MTARFDSELTHLEKQRSEGLTSQEILGNCRNWGSLSARRVLRKYVQLGLLPRSIRVGEKGKHRGSKGLYPVRVVRQILVIKEMMALDYTIEQIRERFLFLQGELDELDVRLQSIFRTLSAKVMGEPKRRELGAVRDLNAARGVGNDLMVRLRSLQTRLETQPRTESVQEAHG